MAIQMACDAMKFVGDACITKGDSLVLQYPLRRVVGSHSTNLSAAVALAIGIGLQDFPEGIAVAMPLRTEGTSRWKSFWYGQRSAASEPVAAVIGAAAVVAAAPILPYALSFGAGAMIYVVVEELIPEAHREGNVDWRRSA